MATTELKTNESFELIPAAEADEIAKMDSALTEARSQIDAAPVFKKAFVLARATVMIRDMISDAFLADIRALMGTQTGFKTDRDKPKWDDKAKKYVDQKPYPDNVVKDCVTVALLRGAQLTGNEFNILAGSCYFTKEFCEPLVKRWPGVTDVDVQIGNPKRHNDANLASVSCRAAWKRDGHPQQLVFDYDGQGIDNRIIVNAYKTSGIDQLKGLAEAKVYKQIIKRLQGGAAIDNDPTQDGRVVEGNVLRTTTEENAESASRAAANWGKETYALLSDCQTIGDVNKVKEHRSKHLGEQNWPESIINEADMMLMEYSESKISEIRGTRGENSNA